MFEVIKGRIKIDYLLNFLCKIKKKTFASHCFCHHRATPIFLNFCFSNGPTLDFFTKKQSSTFLRLEFLKNMFTQKKIIIIML